MELADDNMKFERRKKLMICAAGYTVILVAIAAYILVINGDDDDDDSDVSHDDDNDVTDDDGDSDAVEDHEDSDEDTVEGDGALEQEDEDGVVVDDEDATGDDGAIEQDDGEDSFDDADAAEFDEDVTDADGVIEVDDNDDGAFNESHAVEDEASVNNSVIVAASHEDVSLDKDVATNANIENDDGNDDGAVGDDQIDDSVGGVRCQQSLLEVPQSVASLSSRTSSPKGKNNSEDKLLEKVVADLRDVSKAMKNGHLFHSRTEFLSVFDASSSYQRLPCSAGSTQDKLLGRLMTNMSDVEEALKNCHTVHSNANHASNLNGMEGFDQAILENFMDNLPQKRARLDFSSLSPGA